MLRDTNGDGKADQKETVADGIKDVHGITIHNNQINLATVKEIVRAVMMQMNLR